MAHPDLPYWLAFARVPRIGSRRVQRLETAFGSLRDAWTAPRAQLQAAGLDAATLRSFLQARGKIDPAAEEAALGPAGIQAYTWHDSEYPRRLREVDGRPPVLFVRGELLARDEWAVAVVGTRKVSPYGRQVTEELCRGLAQNGVTVISGLARGVDGIAHQAALDSGGRSIGVLASGLDIIYPPEHAGLARRVAQQGALVSEQSLGVRPRADYFPRRNRILSGLALGSLIVEAGEGSGVLHTANWANEQNREVFAVPGRITSPTSHGANALIQQGMAKLVTNVADILVELNLQMVEHQVTLGAALPEDPAQAAVLEQVGPEPLHTDDAVRAVGLPSSTVSSTLAMLGLKGMVRQVGPMLYVRT